MLRREFSIRHEFESTLQMADNDHSTDQPAGLMQGASNTGGRIAHQSEYRARAERLSGPTAR